MSVTKTVTPRLPSPSNHIPFLEDIHIIPYNTSDFTLTPSEAGTLSFSLSDNISHYYSEYLSPLVNQVSKTQVDNLIIYSLSASFYYRSMGIIGFSGDSFVKKAFLSTGYKVFYTFANPAIAQVVEPATEYLQKSFLQDKTEAAAATSSSSLDNEHNDYGFNFSFDFERYHSDLSLGIDKLTPKNLLISAIISEAASTFKDITYSTLGFNDYCQGYFCKNWFTYYFKEWLKKEIKNELPDILKEERPKIIVDNDQTTINLDDVIKTKDFIDAIEDISTNHSLTSVPPTSVYEPITPAIPVTPVIEEPCIVITHEF